MKKENKKSWYDVDRSRQPKKPRTMRELIIVLLSIPLLFMILAILSADKFGWWMVGGSAFILLLIFISLDCYQGKKRQMFWGGLMVLIAALGFLGWATSILYVGHYSQMSGGSRRARLGARFFNSIYEYFGITGVVVAMLAMSILCFYVSYKVFKKRLDY